MASVLAQLAKEWPGATAAQLQQFADALAPYVYPKLTARIQGDVRDDRKTRWLVSGADIKRASASATADLKLPGESYFDRINLANGMRGFVDSDINKRQLNISPPSGMMNVDYVVDSNGNGTHLTLFGASGAFAQAIADAADRVIWVCTTHTETTSATTSLNGWTANQQQITILSAGPYRPYIKRGHAGAIFNMTTNTGLNTRLRIEGINFYGEAGTGNHPIMTCNSGASIPSLELINVGLEAASGASFSYLVNADNSNAQDLIVDHCIDIDAGLLGVVTSIGATTNGCFILRDSTLMNLNHISARAAAGQESADDWGTIATTGNTPNGIQILDNRLQIADYAWRRANNVPMVVSGNHIRYTGATQLFRVGTSATTSPKDFTAGDNEIIVTTGGLTGACFTVTGGAGTASAISIMNNTLAGPGSGTAIDLARLQESTTDGYTILNSYRDWTTNVSGVGAPGLTLPPATIIPAPAMTPEVLIVGDPGTLGAMLRLDGVDANDEVNTRFGRSNVWKAHVGLYGSAAAFEAARTLNDFQFGMVSGSASFATGAGGTFHVPLAIANDASVIRTYTATVQLGNGSDLVLYSDAYTTIKAQIDAALGRSLFLGAMRVGSATVAPTNIADGDLTATRLIVPNATIVHSAVAQLGSPVVIPTGGVIRFSDLDDSNYVALTSPAVAQSENYIYALPDDDPSNGQIWAVKSIALSPLITTEWITAAAGSNALLDGSAHTDTTNSPVTRGDIIFGNSTPAWDDMAAAADRKALFWDGTDAVQEYTVLVDTFANRPAAATAMVGRLFMATDRNNTLYRCTSNTTWVVVNPRVAILEWYIDGRLRADASNSQGPIRYLPAMIEGGMTDEAEDIWKPVKAKAHVKTAAAGDDIDIQIEFGTTATPGTDLFSTNLTIAAAANEGTSTSFADSAIENGSAFELILDTVGTTVNQEGTDLSVIVEFVQIDG